jgi:hypothetical protein
MEEELREWLVTLFGPEAGLLTTEGLTTVGQYLVEEEREETVPTDVALTRAYNRYKAEQQNARNRTLLDAWEQRTRYIIPTGTVLGDMEPLGGRNPYELYSHVITHGPKAIVLEPPTPHLKDEYEKIIDWLEGAPEISLMPVIELDSDIYMGLADKLGFDNIDEFCYTSESGQKTVIRCKIGEK